MLISLIPSAFAAEKNLAVHDNTRKYAFTLSAYGKTGTTTSTQDYWNTETVKSVSDQWNLVSRAGTNWMQLRDDANGSNYNWNAYQYQSDGGVVVAIRIDVDEAGAYIPKLTYNTMTDGYIHDIFLVPDDGSVEWTNALTTNKSKVEGFIEGKAPIATIDMWGEQSGVKKTAVLDSQTLAKGNYLLILRSNGYNEKTVPYQPDNRLFIRAEISSFELVRDVNAEAIANGELEYVLGVDVLNRDKMFVHGQSGSAAEGLRSTSLLHHVPYMDWEFTTTLGPDNNMDRVGDVVEPYNTMDITKTDPYRIDNALKNGGLYGIISTQIKPADGSSGVYATAKIADYKTDDLQEDRAQIVLRVNIPYAGKYTMTTRGWKYHQGVVHDVRFARATTEERLSITEAAKLPIIGKYYANNATADESIAESTAVTGEVKNTEYGQPISIEVPEAGEYWIVYDTSKASLDANPYYVNYKSGNYQIISLTGVKLTPVAEDLRLGFALSASKTALTAGETVALTATETMRDAGARAVAAAYRSSSPSVATVSADGTVTAVAGGRALITAEAADGATDSFWVTVSDKAANNKVAYAITTSVSPSSIKVESGDRNEKITVTAEDIDGYKFRHWVRGSADNGSWVSSDKSFSFNLMTNTYLTAVYTEDKDEKLVEFFNENGEYYAEAAADAEGKVALPADPTRTGFKFAKWLLSEEIEFTADTVVTADITRAVARYEASEETFAVTLPDASVENLFYGDEVTLKAEYVKDGTAKAYSAYWYRDGKQVAYGTEYKYLVWDDTVITKSTAGVQAPTVVLDKVKKSGNAYMIEYDAMGKEIVEVGIIFGSGNHTVESCDSKATSQNTKSHGQFTAKPGKTGGTVARGYLIYNDKGTYRVVYSD